MALLGSWCLARCCCGGWSGHRESKAQAHPPAMTLAVCLWLCAPLAFLAPVSGSGAAAGLQMVDREHSAMAGCRAAVLCTVQCKRGHLAARICILLLHHAPS